MFTDKENAALAACLEEDHKATHTMKMAGASESTASKETLTTATAKAIAAGHTLKTIFAAVLSGYIASGMPGAIAAVLALIATP